MLVAAAAMTFFACQKQEVIAPETSQEVMLTFSSEKPAFDDETKTEWTGETIQWSKGDKISVAYTVDGNWQGANGNADGNAKLYKSSELAEAADFANFNVSADFKGTTEGTSHVFYGVYPAPQSTDFPNAPVASLTIPANQTPNANTFDASGDLMVGISKEYESRPASGETISLKWNRLVAHAVITLKEINGFIAGETLTGITLTAQEGANLVGKQNVELTTGAVENNDGASNVIKIAPGNLSVDAKGTVTFWVCVLPETLTSLTVEVDTDQATYTREITGISKTFKKNARNTLAVNMSSATRVTKETESWVLVTPADGITEGTYALVASTSTKTGVLVSTNGSSSAPAFNTGITIEDSVLKGVAEAMQFDIAAVDGGYTLAVAGQTTNYLYTTSSNNGVRVGTNDNKIWTIGTHADNSSAFVFKCNATSRFLGVYNNSDWRCYTTYDAANYKADEGSSEIYLYKKTLGAVAPDTTPSVELEVEELELTAEESEGTIEIEAKNIASIEVRALVEEGAQDESEWLTAEYDEANSCVTYSAEANESEESRTAYIEVYCLDAEGNEIVAGVNVTQEGFVDESELPVGITYIYDAITSESNSTLDEFSVSLTDAVVTYVNGNSAFVEDATAGILIYKSGHSLVAGDKLNGVLTGKGYVRYGVCQITEFDMANITKETGAAIPYVEITVADLLSDYASYVSRRVKIVDATVTDGIAGTSDKNGAVSQNGNSVNLYNNTSVNFVETEVVDFYAYPSYYNTTKQLATWEAPTTKKVATPVIACASNVVTITCGTAGASLYYAIGNGEFAAYTEGVEIDETVTIKAYATKSDLADSEVASQECEYVDLNTQPETVEASLSFANKAQRTTFTTAQQVWTQNGITLTNDKGSSTSNVADYANPARFYKSSKITVVAPGNITKIVFTCNSSSYATALKSSIPSGTVTVTVSGSDVTVIPASSADSFVIDSLTGGQVRMNSLKVTYEK